MPLLEVEDLSVRFQTDDGPDARAEAEARLRAARARLTSIENGQPVEAIPILVQNLREARTRLAEIESLSLIHI